MTYKINPSNIYGLPFNPNEWGIPEENQPSQTDRLTEWKRLGVTAINVGYVNPSAVPSEEELNELLNQMEETLSTLEEWGLRDRAYCYMFDEAAPDRWPVMRPVSNAIKERFPDLLLLTTAVHTSLGREGDLDAIDAWCPHLRGYDYEAAQQASARGKQVWWYTCNSPNPPYPNLFLVNSAMATRQMMGFMPFSYGVDGFLYWNMGGDWPQKIQDAPYTNWQVTSPLGWGNVYELDPQGEPLPSVRMEAIRDGMEDYDYLYICREQMAALGKKGISTPELDELAAHVKPFFTPDNSLVQSTTRYSQDPEELEAARQLVARYIVLSRDLLK